MGTLIPTLGAARFDARSELRLAERMKDCLEDNVWLCRLAYATVATGVIASCHAFVSGNGP
jgi:hypothetical protein